MKTYPMPRSSKNLKLRSDIDIKADDDSDSSNELINSAIIGAVTDSSIVGAVLGGSIVGGIIGDLLGGD